MDYETVVECSVCKKLCNVKIDGLPHSNTDVDLDIEITCCNHDLTKTN